MPTHIQCTFQRDEKAHCLCPPIPMAAQPSKNGIASCLCFLPATWTGTLSARKFSSHAWFTFSFLLLVLNTFTYSEDYPSELFMFPSYLRLFTQACAHTPSNNTFCSRSNSQVSETLRMQISVFLLLSVTLWLILFLAPGQKCISSHINKSDQ